MGLFDSLRGTEQREEAGYDAAQIDADLATALTSPGERDAISVRPNKDNGGIEAMTDVLESLHSVETDSPRLSRSVQNVSPAHSFEMRYTREQGGGDRVVTMQYVAGDDRTDGTLKRQLQTQYPDSQLIVSRPRSSPSVGSKVGTSRVRLSNCDGTRCIPSRISTCRGSRRTQRGRFWRRWSARRMRPRRTPMSSSR